MMKKTTESTEQTWTKNVKSQEILEQAEKSPVLFTADAKRSVRTMDRR